RENGAFARKPRWPRLRRRPSFSTGSKPTGGAFLLVRTPGGSMTWFAIRRNALTMSTFSRALQPRSAGVSSDKNTPDLPHSEDSALEIRAAFAAADVVSRRL